MKYINSVHNPVIKNFRKLKSDQKTRHKQGLTVLDGIHLAESYLDAGFIPEYCVVSESSSSNREVQNILNSCQKLNVKIIAVPDNIFRAIATVEKSVGLMLYINIPKTSITEIIKQDSVIFDRIQDPGNLGTMMRTAAAAGVREIYCSKQTVSTWSPKVLRAGMGAHFTLDIYEDCNVAQLIKTSKIPIFAATLSASQTIYNSNLIKPCAWIFGNEGQGVSEELLQRGITQLFIPQASVVESLNVSAAAAICLFEQRRQRIVL